MSEPGYIALGANVSECGRYRYRLWRLWDELAPVMVWVLLNPSTADAETDDPTLRKCVGFAKKHQYGGVILVNLFAYRASDPKELLKVSTPIGPENDSYIEAAIRAPVLATVVAGWGAERFAENRARAVKLLICGALQRQIRCFGKSKHGHPRHPLYLPYTSTLEAL
jgi:hypothetical protein